MRIRQLLPALSLLLALTACGAVTQVQRYGQPRVMLCTQQVPLRDAATALISSGSINPGDTVQVLGSIVQFGVLTNGFLVSVGGREAAVTALTGLVDLNSLAPHAVAGEPPSGATKAIPRATDPQIGTDEKGRPLYQGPEGGIYYINANGNKTYVKRKK